VDYLVIVAHPDDEVLGAGGSMAKWVQNGSKVHVLIMAEGATSRHNKRDRKLCKDELNILEKSANASAQVIGLSSIELLDFPDNRMDTISLLDVVKVVENKIIEFSPDVIVTHHFGDLNVDHQIINQAVLAAGRPQPNSKIKRILSCEVSSSTEWQAPGCKNTFMPNWFEDISDTIETKKASLKEYQSEMRNWPHARSIEAVESLARFRGATVGVPYAEAFMLLRGIN